MHDIVIRGGKIIDGTGKTAFTGDVAIADGRIAALGGKQGPAKRNIDADGLVVTPGWVDAHTHYDGQAMWDPLLAPSCWHGVTTVLFGNCGVGFAPVKKQHRGALMDLMEGVEEIPNPVLAAGLNWEWETFPQFMDSLERRPHAIDIASVAAIAAREGRPPDEVAYDYMTGGEGQYLYFPVVNYVSGDHAPILEMLNDPACLLGLSDGGAHCTSIVDSGVPTFMLMHWGRDRSRGPRLPLEHLVKRQTSETADFFGFSDRGRLAPGLRADINVIDFDNLKVRKPELVHDMPAGGPRFVQHVQGYETTLVAGTPIFERGEHTGAMPGRLVRAGRESAVLAAE